MQIYIYVNKYICTNDTYTYMLICMYSFLSDVSKANLNPSVCVCACICMCVCARACMCMCVYAGECVFRVYAWRTYVFACTDAYRCTCTFACV